MKKQLMILATMSLALSACIQDDVIFDTVEETFRITNPIDTLAVGDSYLFESRYTNNVGQENTANISWSSSNPQLIEIDNSGTVTGIAQGQASIYAEVVKAGLSTIGDTLSIIVSDQTTTVNTDSRSGVIATTTFYQLEGDFVVRQEGNQLKIEISENYRASNSLPGLYVYLTNNPNTTAGALEIGKVTTFSGAHSYTINDVDIKDYDYLLYFCKPFRVKVGDGKID
jgi:hypothetical protein